MATLPGMDALVDALRSAPSDTWRANAACRTAGTHLFFDDTPAGRAAAKQVCQVCTARFDCLVDALRWPAVEQHGVAGGLGALSRRRLVGQIAAHSRAVGIHVISRRPTLADRVRTLAHLPVDTVAAELAVDPAVVYRVLRAAS